MKKPYVFLEVDHVGKRKPERDGEPDTGIYLRIVNNCRMPIVIWTFSAQDGGLGVMDRVVPNNMQMGLDNAVHLGAPLSPSYSGIPDDFLTPEMKEEKERQAEEHRTQAQHSSSARKVPPVGYFVGDVFTTIPVPPGGKLQFSLPINHVSEGWHVEIPFRFDLKHKGKEREPKSALVLYMRDLP
jgi:hypothetical protein